MYALPSEVFVMPKTVKGEFLQKHSYSLICYLPVVICNSYNSSDFTLEILFVKIHFDTALVGLNDGRVMCLKSKKSNNANIVIF